MDHLRRLYKDSLGLLTDLYQLTMAYGYWKLGRSDLETAFHLIFRNNPFDGGFSVACGLASAVEFLDDFHFESDDLDIPRDAEGQRREAAL
jgi:nicotinate phosphoribosyltransferase